MKQGRIWLVIALLVLLPGCDQGQPEEPSQGEPLSSQWEPQGERDPMDAVLWHMEQLEGELLYMESDQTDNSSGSLTLMPDEGLMERLRQVLATCQRLPEDPEAEFPYSRYLRVSSASQGEGWMIALFAADTGQVYCRRMGMEDALYSVDAGEFEVLYREAQQRVEMVEPPLEAFEQPIAELLEQYRLEGGIENDPLEPRYTPLPMGVEVPEPGEVTFTVEPGNMMYSYLVLIPMVSDNGCVMTVGMSAFAQDGEEDPAWHAVGVGFTYPERIYWAGNAAD